MNLFRVYLPFTEAPVCFDNFLAASELAMANPGSVVEAVLEVENPRCNWHAVFVKRHTNEVIMNRCVDKRSAFFAVGDTLDRLQGPRPAPAR